MTDYRLYFCRLVDKAYNEFRFNQQDIAKHMGVDPVTITNHKKKAVGSTKVMCLALEHLIYLKRRQK